MAKMTTSELDTLIRKKIQEKGLLGDISEEKINEIKAKIKKASLQKPSAIIPTMMGEDEENVVLNLPKTEVTPETITQTTTINNTEVELAKKEGELNAKEDEISNKQADLANREAELQRKQDEAAYKPVIPAVLENLGPEKMFVFNTNELSLGAEALSKTKFRLMSNPDEKKSMDDVWACEGKKVAEIYVVKFEKIGDIEFNPFEGTSKFTEKRFDQGENPENVPIDGLTPEEAIKSQEPTEPMIDVIIPVTNATLPATEDMGLKSLDFVKIVNDRVDAILKNYFAEKFPKL